MTADLASALVAVLERRFGEVRVDASPDVETALDIVGAVVPLRGRWWGVVLMKCERALVEDLAARTREFVDAVLRDLVLELGRAVRPHLDPTGTLGAPISLDGENSGWQPRSSVLVSRTALSVAGRALVIEIHRRRRSDEVPQVDDEDRERPESSSPQ
jgi:hypothetical protein